MKSYYELLNIDADADKRDIKRAFHKLAKRYHPDLSSKNGMFLKILNAYETLVDDNKRKLYNLKNTRVKPGIERVLPKNRVSFALSLQDLVDLRCFYRKTTVRRSGHFKPKGYDVSVYLTNSELTDGSIVNIDIPAHVVCPVCGGNRVFCSLCSHKGQILKAVPVPVTIPPDLEDGEIFSVPLRKLKQKKYAYFMVEDLYVKIKIFQE